MSPGDPKVLLKQVSLGDREAFSALYEAVSGRLFAVALGILRDRAEAEEALQDCFINIWRRAKSFDEARAAPMTWLIAIARNAAIDRARRRREMVNLDDLPERADAGAVSPEAAVAKSQAARRLNVCLDILPDYDRALIRAAFMGGLSYSELAAQESKPLGTIKSTIRRGLIKLRHELEQ